MPASGKKDGPIIRVPMTESGGPAGGHGDTAVLFPWKVGGGLGPWFRTKWHRGPKPRAKRRSVVFHLRIMHVPLPGAAARRRSPLVIAPVGWPAPRRSHSPRRRPRLQSPCSPALVDNSQSKCSGEAPAALCGPARGHMKAYMRPCLRNPSAVGQIATTSEPPRGHTRAPPGPEPAHEELLASLWLHHGLRLTSASPRRDRPRSRSIQHTWSPQKLSTAEVRYRFRKELLDRHSEDLRDRQHRT